MTTRDTSRTAYDQLRSTGQLKGQQERVLGSLVRYGASTSGELFHKMEIENVNAWRARITELQARGLIVETGQRKCKITGRLALVWEYSGRLVPLPAKGKNASTKELRELASRAVALLKREEGANSTVVSQWMASAKACGIKGA